MLLAGTDTPKHNSTLQLAALLTVADFKMQLCRSQLQQIMCMLDSLAVWNLRNNVALLRPNGWRSQPSSPSNWR